MDKRITEYISSNSILTLATSGEEGPWCAICFYAFLKEDNLLVFISDFASRHIREGLNLRAVAGSITGTERNIARIRGIQFEGKLFSPRAEVLERSKRAYFGQYPMARAFSKPVWGIELMTVKMTDNTLGFGNKIIWEKAGDITYMNNE